MLTGLVVAGRTPVDGHTNTGRKNRQLREVIGSCRKRLRAQPQAVSACSSSLHSPVSLGDPAFSRWECPFSHGLFDHRECLLLSPLLLIVTVIACQHVYSILPLLVINSSVLSCRYTSMLSSSSRAQLALCCALGHWHMRGKSGSLLLFHKASKADGKASEPMAYGFAAAIYCPGSCRLAKLSQQAGLRALRSFLALVVDMGFSGSADQYAAYLFACLGYAQFKHLLTSMLYSG